MAVSVVLGLGAVLWLDGRGGPFWAMLFVGLATTAAILWLSWIADRRCFAVRGRFSPARRRLMWRFMPAMGVYVGLLFLSSWLFDTISPTGPLAVLLALAPAAPLVVAIFALGAYAVEEDDEFQRAIQMRAFIMATAIAMAICTVWGFLDAFQVVPHAEMWVIFPLWALCLGLSHPLVRRRYQ